MAVRKEGGSGGKKRIATTREEVKRGTPMSAPPAQRHQRRFTTTTTTTTTTTSSSSTTSTMTTTMTSVPAGFESSPFAQSLVPLGSAPTAQVRRNTVVTKRSNSSLFREAHGILRKIADRRGVGVAALSSQLDRAMQEESSSMTHAAASSSSSSSASTPAGRQLQAQKLFTSATGHATGHEHFLPKIDVLTSSSSTSTTGNSEMKLLSMRRAAALEDVQEFRKRSSMQLSKIGNRRLLHKMSGGESPRQVELSQRYVDFAKHSKAGSATRLPGMMQTEYKSLVQTLKKDGAERKTEELLRMVKVVSKLSPNLFGRFEPETLTELCRTMKFQKLQRGSFVYKQGEVGELFYIIADGRAEFRRGDDDDASRETTPSLDSIHTDRTISKLKKGDSFGELVLLGNDESCVRSSSVLVTSSSIELITIHKDEFNKVYGDAYGAKIVDVVSFLRGIKVFSKENSTRLKQLAPHFRVETFKEGKLFELDSQDTLYIIIEGDICISHLCAESRNTFLFREKLSHGAKKKKPRTMKLHRWQSRRLSATIDEILDGLSQRRTILGGLNEDEEVMDEPSSGGGGGGVMARRQRPPRPAARGSRASTTNDERTNNKIIHKSTNAPDKDIELGRLGAKAIVGYSSIIPELRRGWVGKVTSKTASVYAIDIGIFLSIVCPSVLSAIKKEEHFKLMYHDNVKRERLAALRNNNVEGRGGPVYAFKKTYNTASKASARS